MKRINLVISDDEYQWLKNYAGYSGVTMTHVIRQFIRELEGRSPSQTDRNSLE
jgi:hypothetical protein